MVPLKTSKSHESTSDVEQSSSARANLSPDRATLLSLVEASRAITSEPELRGAFQQITTRARALLKSEAASLQLFDPDRQQLVFEASTGPGAQELIGERFDAKLGIAGDALRTRRAIRVDNVREHPNFFPGIDQKTRLCTRCILAVPLIHRDRVVGVLEVVNPIGREQFTDADLEVAEILTRIHPHAGCGIGHFTHSWARLDSAPSIR